MARGTSSVPAVLVGGEHIALAVARSLASRGVTVYALGHHDDPLRSSRHCDHFEEVGSGLELQTASLEWLENGGPREGVLIPCDDEPLEMVARNRQRLVAWGYRPLSFDDDVVLSMLDKERTYDLASELEVAAPRTRRVRTASDARRAAAEIGFPCALKPLVSHEWARQFPLHTKALMATTSDELEEICAQWGSLTTDVMMTEFVPGGDDRCWAYIAHLDADGVARAEATKQRVRQYLPGFGSSTYTVMRWDKEVAAAGLAFLRGVGARGPVYVEFKRDPRDEKLKLIECNHRFTGPTELLRRGGVDLPFVTYSHEAGLGAPPSGSRLEDVALWSPWLDFRAFLAYRSQGEVSVGGWLRSLKRKKFLPIATLDDPKPTMVRARRRVVATIARRLGWRS